MIKETMMGKGREAIEMLTDDNSFAENVIGAYNQPSELGPGAVIGTAKIDGKNVTIIASDAKPFNPRFPVVYSGVIGLEEGYKMAKAVYRTIAADKDSALKRPILLIVDTPGNGPGKTEEIFGMNKSTGAYQLSLAEAREKGHPIIALIIGRAISGAFLCHGLQADHILSLSADFGTMIHVMPISSIARITKMDVETLENLSKTNPVFASGAGFFYKLGGLEEVIDNIDDMAGVVKKHIAEVYKAIADGKSELTGPMGRGTLGNERGGRVLRAEVLDKMKKQFESVEGKYIDL